MPFPNRAQLPYVWGAKLPPNQLKEKKNVHGGGGGGGISLCDLAVFLIFCHTFLHNKSNKQFLKVQSTHIFINHNKDCKV